MTPVRPQGPAGTGGIPVGPRVRGEKPQARRFGVAGQDANPSEGPGFAAMGEAATESGGSKRPRDGGEARTGRRRRLLLASAVPVVVVVLLALRLMSLPMLTSSAQSAFADGNADGLREAGSAMAVGNPVERWRAPFAEGTGFAMAADYEAARPLLERALAGAGTDHDRCLVLTNLAVTIDGQARAADEAGDTRRRESLAAEGLGVIEGAPAGCLDGTNDGQSGRAGETLRTVQESLIGYAGQAPPEPAPRRGEPTKPAGDDPAGEDKRRQLTERNRQGTGEAGDSRADAGSGQGTPRPDEPPVDRPW